MAAFFQGRYQQEIHTAPTHHTRGDRIQLLYPLPTPKQLQDSVRCVSQHKGGCARQPLASPGTWAKVHLALV